MRTDGVAEAGVVVTAFEAIRAGVLAVGEADRELTCRLELVVDDRLARDRGPDDAIPPPVKRRDQDVELVRSDHRGRRRDAHSATVAPGGADQHQRKHRFTTARRPARRRP
jgi:hypothetical protein